MSGSGFSIYALRSNAQQSQIALNECMIRKGNVNEKW